MSDNQRLSYRPDVDGLRAIAICSVVIFHAFPHLASGGFVGVDVFFVISGYLITRLIMHALPLDSPRQGSFRLVRFYAHRIRRIFPALILVLIGCLMFGWFFLLADEYKQLGKEVLTGAFFVENISLWGEADYFDTAAELKPLLHLWSLGIEEQFYIVWPILLVLAVRLQFNLFILTVGIALASFAANVIAINEHANAAAFYLPITRIWELMAGGTLAYLDIHRRESVGEWGEFIALAPWLHSPSIRANIKSGLGSLLILIAVFFLNKSDAFPGWLALLPTIGAYLVISAGQGAWINRHILGSRLFVLLGLVSYPLYLWHWPLLSFARILEGDTPTPELRIASVVAAFVLSCLTYVLVEKRVRYKTHWAATLSLACVLTLLAGIGFNIFDRDGLEFRLKGSELERVKFNTTLQYQTQCRRDFKFAEDSFCLRGSEDRPPTVALIGDSHAMTMFPGLGQYYAKHGENLVHFGKGGGIPFYDVERIIDGNVSEHYSKLFASILDYVCSEADIKTVILMNKSLRQGSEPLRYRLDPDNTDALDVYGKAMTRTVEKLISAGKQVIVISDNPMVDFDPGTCLARPSLGTAARSLCAVSRASYEAQTELYRNKIDEVLKRFPTVKRWDPANYLCDAQNCWASKDGKMLYGRDGQHLTIAASYWLADHFAPQ